MDLIYRNEVGRFCSEIVEQTAWYTGKVVTGFSFKNKASGSWLLSVKVAGVGLGHIAFVEADRIDQCLELYVILITRPWYGKINWVIAKW